MNKLLSDLYRWLDDRLEVSKIVATLFDEPIPGGARWSYVFGSGLLFLFTLQAVTGAFLTMYYVPSADHAHTTVAFIQKVVTGGAFIRGLHHWSSTMMVVMLSLHMLQAFFWGAYKKPREMVWVFGAVLMLLVLGFSFTGYLLPWDQKAYFATAVGTNVASEVPVIGGFLKAVALGGSELGTITLSRFFMMHVMVLPALTILFIGLHVFAFRKAGPAGPYRDNERAKRVDRFYPRQFLYDTVFAAMLFVILAGLAVAEPASLEPKADPSDAEYLPRPEWYFLPLFQLLKVFEGQLAIIGTVIIPGLLFTTLFLLPFIDRSTERNPFRRRIASMGMIAVFLALGALFLQARRDDGAFLSGSEVERLGSLSQEEVQDLTPAEQQRRDFALNKRTLDEQMVLAHEFIEGPFEPDVIGNLPRPVRLPSPPTAYSVCAECHGDIGGGGGLLAQDLITVGEEYTREQLLELLDDPDQFDIIGMPSFTDDKMSQEEREAIVDYLVDLAGR